MAQPFPIKNVYREDVVVPGLDRQEVLDNAPAPQDGRFRVPPSNGSES
jgi:aspartyl-tRNA(Asn)/glutamyl-tRNA(Gln) amidotransferase subunit C